MAILTYTEQLEEVQSAITAVLTNAQEAVYNGQRVRKADLQWLHEREMWLRPLAVREGRSGGGMPIRGVTPV